MRNRYRGLVASGIVFIAILWTAWSLLRFVTQTICSVECQRTLVASLYLSIIIMTMLFVRIIPFLFVRATWLHNRFLGFVQECVRSQNHRSARVEISRYVSGALLSFAVFTIVFFLPLQALFGLLPMGGVLLPISLPSLAALANSSTVAAMIPFAVCGPLLLYWVRISRLNGVDRAVENASRAFVLLVYWAIVDSVVNLLQPNQFGVGQWLALLQWYVLPGSVCCSTVLWFREKGDGVTVTN